MQPEPFCISAASKVSRAGFGMISNLNLHNAQALKFAEAVATNAGQPAHTEVVAAATAESVATGATGITPLESVLPRELPGTGEGC